jgi:hypothetical protein
VEKAEAVSEKISSRFIYITLEGVLSRLGLANITLDFLFVFLRLARWYLRDGFANAFICKTMRTMLD